MRAEDMTIHDASVTRVTTMRMTDSSFSSYIETT